MYNTAMNKSQKSRLYPKKGRSGYYMLNAMRKASLYIIEKYFSNIKLNRIVDYGCGCSPYQPLFEPCFDEYIRADITDDKEVLKINEDGSLPLEDGSVNTVISTQVLEHVADVDVYLSECYRVLAESGWLLLSTHGYWTYHPSPTDYWRWTRDGLKKKLEQHGFFEIEILGLICPEASGLQLFSINIERHFPGPVKRIFRRMTHFLMWLIDKYKLNHNDAGVYYCIMRKNVSGRSG